MFIFSHIDSNVLLQLNRLVTEKWVDGWDDPRLMTLAGLRRRGVTSTSINTFIRGIGITRRLGIFCLGISKDLPNIFSFLSFYLVLSLIFIILCGTVIVV